MEGAAAAAVAEGAAQVGCLTEAEAETEAETEAAAGMAVAQVECSIRFWEGETTAVEGMREGTEEAGVGAAAAAAVDLLSDDGGFGQSDSNEYEKECM